MTANKSDIRLSVQQVRKVYGAGTRNEVEAVRSLTFDLLAGVFACLVGPSGSGKTTLL